MKLKDQVAIVTGGGRGIGRAISLAFAKEGANVAVVAKTESEIESVAEDIRKTGVLSLAIKADVSVEEQVEAMVKKVMEEFGRIDILVNNAGFAKHGYIYEVETDVWDLTMNVNLRGVMLCTRAVFKNMMKQGNGYIINISSGAGKGGGARYSTYSTSKFGVIGFTQSIAIEGREYGIKASVICPGPVATRMRAGNHPGEDPTKILQPQDIADLALFLVSQPKRVYIGEVVIFPFPS